MSFQVGIERAPDGPALTRRSAGLRRALEHVLFGLVPLVATFVLFAFQSKINGVALDVRVAYWPAASRLLHGASPYVATQFDLAHGWAFVYPAVSALLMAPMALVSNSASQFLWTLVCIACVPSTLWALNVRDWRVYGLVMLWAPVFAAWASGNMTLLLALVIALAWRHRERPVVCGLLVTAALSIKLFVWPIGLWLLVTRRWRAAAWALAVGLAVNLLAWAVIGFGEIQAFLHLSSADAAALWKGGYSVMAVAHHLGFGHAGAEAALVGIAAASAAALIHVGAVRRRERDAFVLSVLLMLLASPLLWSHYFALLLIPLALARPRLGLVWGVGLLMWPMPPRIPVYLWQEALSWGVAAVCVTIAVTEGPRLIGRRDNDWAGRPQPS